MCNELCGYGSLLNLQYKWWLRSEGECVERVQNKDISDVYRKIVHGALPTVYRILIT